MTTINSYHFVNWSNMTTFGDFIHNANASAGNWLFSIIDFLVFLVLFVSLAGAFGWESALLSSGFIAVILSLLFVYMGVMSWTIAGIFVGGLLLMIMYVIWSNRYD